MVIKPKPLLNRQHTKQPPTPKPKPSYSFIGLSLYF